MALMTIGVSAAAVLFGCSAALRTRIMHFFFEYPEDSAPAPGSRKAAGPDATSRGDAPWDPFALPSRLASRHPPFVNRECESCHIRRLSQTPRPDFMVACRECHQPMFAYHRFGHAPAAAHECRLCHFMHVSEEHALLKAPERVLCTRCHPANYDETARSTYHQGIDTLRCTACHDPHFADNSLYLKPDVERERVRADLRTAATRCLAFQTQPGSER